MKWILWLVGSLPVALFGQSDFNLKYTNLPTNTKVSGVNIAIFDAGFLGCQDFPWFQKIIEEGRLKGTYNLVNPKEGVFQYADHGTRVLSVIEGDDSLFYGAAPGANYYLFVTEDVFSERIEEEHFWAKAFHMADSLGVDIINSSLSYTEFDDSTQNHTHQELDGKTAPISQAARKALDRDILLVSSAGNYANDPWNHIGFPADADSIISVGAIDVNGNITNFSSYGYTVDNRPKPEVVAVGQNVRTYGSRGYSTANGTSFSAPVIAGFAAQLLHLFPAISKTQVWEAILASSGNYPEGVQKFGYGVPDFAIAKENLKRQEINQVAIYPNPVKSGGVIALTSTGFSKMRLIDSRGKLISETRIEEGQAIEIPAHLETGLYVILLTREDGEPVSSLIQVVS